MISVSILEELIEGYEGWLKPEAVFQEDTVSGGIALHLENGTVDKIQPVVELPYRTALRSVPGVVSVGFIDLQVNGGGGVMLNNDPTAEGVLTIARAHRLGGTVGLLPTVVTDRPEIIRQAAEAVLAVWGQEGVLGIHIEGPHINPIRKGAHNPRFIRPLDCETLDLIESLRACRLPVMLTLAPEMVAPGQIAELVKMGVIVSAGHTDATADQVETAISEGLSCFTHLYNGMSQITAREPGVVGKALISDQPCGIIADGYHVDKRVIQLAFVIPKRRGRIFVVSDAMATWNGPDHFDLYGEPIKLSGGKLVNQEGVLSGAHIDMARCVSNLLDFGIPAAEALAAATTVPAATIGLPRIGTLLGANQSSLVLIGQMPIDK
jgi:N-acetylglucosamine-6-phosphate deacetylase